MTPNAASPTTPRAAPGSGVRALLIEQGREPMVRAVWLSLGAAVLALAPTLYMSEVYGRALNSLNPTTLLMLLLGMGLALAMMEALHRMAGAQLLAWAARVDEQLTPWILEASTHTPSSASAQASQRPLDDARQLREFLVSPVAMAVLESPAALVFLGVLCVLSPWLGAMALVGAVLQWGLGWHTERRVLPRLKQAAQTAGQAQQWQNALQQQGTTHAAMGMHGALRQRWHTLQQRFILEQAEASELAASNAAVSRLVQTWLSTLLLGAAAWLTLQGQLQGGASLLIVAITLGSKVLSPWVQVVAQWRQVVQVRLAMARLDAWLAEQGAPPAPSMPLPTPKGMLQVEGLSVSHPGASTPLLKQLSFTVPSGQMLLVVGPSGGGKSTLARTLVGACPATAGKVRLDQADLHAWPADTLGPHLGYLSQDVDLFDASMADNICRFGPHDPTLLQQAVADAGMGEWVARLPQGLDTPVGELGLYLSGGQRQRVGLARALYGRPRLVVLDEPNAHLDEQGDEALMLALQALKRSGAAVVVISHRTSVLPAADLMMLLQDGEIRALGPKDRVLQAFQEARQPAVPASPPAPATPHTPQVPA